MGQFFKAINAGIAGFAESMNEANQPRPCSVAGKPVRCPHCSNTTFLPATAQLNSAGRTFFNLDWTDPSATILICAECGRIEWFAQAPDVDPSRVDLSGIRDLD